MEVPALDQPLGGNAQKLTVTFAKNCLVMIDTFAATDALVRSVRFQTDRLLVMELI
ncbi:MAG: hypothetical protein ACKOBZ_06690 [Nitrospira sp.]